MPKNMSFMLTTDQIRNQTKTVTRRLGWKFLKPGDILNACVKCQGLKKGEKIEKICQIQILSTRWEPLNTVTWEEVRKEGFTMMTPLEFMIMFAQANKVKDPATPVNRIEFKYVEPIKVCPGCTYYQETCPGKVGEIACFQYTDEEDERGIIARIASEQNIDGDYVAMMRNGIEEE